MKHRHLNSEEWNLPAIDNCIVSGGLGDWIELRDDIEKDAALLEKIAQLCEAPHGDEGGQRYAFWKNYVKSRRKISS